MIIVLDLLITTHLKAGRLYLGHHGVVAQAIDGPKSILVHGQVQMIPAVLVEVFTQVAVQKEQISLRITNRIFERNRLERIDFFLDRID